MHKSANYWIEKLELQAHPEGGYFKETYRSKDRIHESKLPDRYKSSRVFGTSIYFLLTTENRSNFHRLNSDEIWLFHTGGAAKIHFISPLGEATSKIIGANIEEQQQLQVVIPKHYWFAAEVIDGDYILVGCTVAPGFEFEDFELAERTKLIGEFPNHRALIEGFTGIQAT